MSFPQLRSAFYKGKGADAGAPAEDISLDKWFVLFEVPAKRAASRATYLPAVVFDPFPIVAAETVTMDEWFVAPIHPFYGMTEVVSY